MTDLTPELAQEIARLVGEGKSFRAIEGIEGMPTRKTMRKWQSDNKDFRLLLENAKKNRSLAKATEFATPERMRQDMGIKIAPIDHDPKTGKVTQLGQRAVVTCKLDWYLVMKTITPTMHKAGSKFARLHFAAGKMPRTTPMYGDFVSGRRGQDIFVDKTDAQIELEKALAVLEAPEADVIWDVCGNDIIAGNGGRIRALQTGLRSLATHFNINPFR